jgi:hypothetical protein
VGPVLEGSCTINLVELAAEVHSIIALMLGRLRMSVTECIAAYLTMSEKVFGQTEDFTKREKFDSWALEEAIKTAVEQKIGNPDAPLQTAAGCKT